MGVAVLNPDRCATVRSLRQQCELAAHHVGDHVHGVGSWPRSARESPVLQQQLARARDLRERALALRPQR